MQIDWAKLNHAYGNASDIPPLLDELKTYPQCEGYKDEPFFSLWSSLCHQGDSYTASYAAVPMIVALIEEAPSKVNYNYFLLPISIEISRLKGRGPEIPKEVEHEYTSSIQKLLNVISRIESPDELLTQVMSATVPIRHGNAELAEAILELTPDVLVEFNEWLLER